MKKYLLLASAVVFTFAVNAQDKSKAVYRDHGQARIDQESNNGPIKQPTIPGEKAATTINIGTSYNTFTILGDRQNQVVYNPDINTVAFVHRQNANIVTGGSGVISFDYSTDGGNTWTINPFALTPGLGGGDGNRYPNIALYNPPANTDTNNAYIVATGPQLKTGTMSGASGWEGTFRASALLNGTNLDEQYTYLSTDAAGDDNEWGAAGLYTNANGVVFDATTNYDNAQTNLVADNYSKYFINKGTYNSTNNNFDWTVAATITPSWYKTMNFTVGLPTNVGSLPNMAWSPDGMTGYMVALGADSTGTGNTMWRPYVMKSTDGGNTWNNVNDYDFSTDATLQTYIWGTNASNGTLKRPFFSSYDMVVDANGELRIFGEIASGFSDDPDSLNYTFAARQAGFLFEVATNGTGWDVNFIDSIYVDDYVWDGSSNALTNYVRPQASRSQNGNVMFYTWSESDPGLAIDREFPVVMGIANDITGNGWSNIKNLSSGNSSEYVAAYQTIAADVIENGVDEQWEIPIVYGTDIGGAALSNSLNPTQWTYLKGVGFTYPDDWTVGINENVLSESDLSLYPNPTAGNLMISVKNVNEFNYTVMDVVGNLIANNHVNGTKTTIDLTNNALGVYFVTIDTENGSVTKKAILTK